MDKTKGKGIKDWFFFCGAWLISLYDREMGWRIATQEAERILWAEREERSRLDREERIRDALEKGTVFVEVFKDGEKKIYPL